MEAAVFVMNVASLQSMRLLCFPIQPPTLSSSLDISLTGVHFIDIELSETDITTLEKALTTNTSLTELNLTCFNLRTLLYSF